MILKPDGAAGSAPPNAFLEDDAWYEWLLQNRHGGDSRYRAILQPALDDLRDRVLDHAKLRPGERLADIGCGDGMLGFGALDRQADSEVTFVDISPALIAHTRAVAAERSDWRQCSFIVASAEKIERIADASIDVITVRAVLAYVSDRPAAIREFYRILRPGGRISIVDPIFQDRAFALAGIASQLRTQERGPAVRYLEMLHRWRAAQLPDTLEAIRQNPLTNYNERDLFRLFENAGFINAHLRLHIDNVAAPSMPWHAFLASSPRAGVLSNGGILATRFSAEERLEFETFFRCGIETGTTVERNTNAYIFAERA